MNKLILFNNLSIMACMTSITVLTLIPIQYTDFKTLIQQCITSNQYLLTGIIGSSIVTMTNEFLKINNEI